MKMKFACWILFVTIFFSTGCTISQPGGVLPVAGRTVKIETFANKTVLYGLEDKLYQKIYDGLMADGRLIPADKNAETRLVGEITTYQLIPLSYDSNSVVEEYKLWMEVNIKFIDNSNGKVIYSENDIPVDIRYYPAGSTQPGAAIETEQQAQERAVNELSSEIIYQLLRYLRFK